MSDHQTWTRRDVLHADGCDVLWPIRGVDGALTEFEALPVVAWAIDQDEESGRAAALPVCVEELPGDWFLRQPNGVVVDPGAGAWPDDEVAIRELRKQRQWAPKGGEGDA